MLNFTPGPWKIFEGYGASRFSPAIVDSIPDVDGKCVANLICHAANTNPDCKANAKLIAAAPDILNALDDLVRAHELPGEHNEVEQALRAAVALLEGLGK